jgi:hypothetical protein
MIWPLTLVVITIVLDLVLRWSRKKPKATVTMSGKEDSGFFQAVLTQYLAMDALNTTALFWLKLKR